MSYKPEILFTVSEKKNILIKNDAKSILIKKFQTYYTKLNH